MLNEVALADYHFGAPTDSFVTILESVRFAKVRQLSKRQLKHAPAGLPITV